MNSVVTWIVKNWNKTCSVYVNFDSECYFCLSVEGIWKLIEFDVISVAGGCYQAT